MGGGVWGLLAGPLFKTTGIFYGPTEDNLMVIVSILSISNALRDRA